MIAACIALCNAVWLMAMRSGETPVPATKTAERQESNRCGNRKQKRIPRHWQKRKTRFLSKKYPKRNVLNQRDRVYGNTCRFRAPRLPQSRHPLRIPHQSQLRPNLLKNCKPGDKVYVAGFGWVEYEGPNHCEDGATFTKTATKSGSWGEICGKHSK